MGSVTHVMTEFILFGGKGGVGKTTCASATALSLAKDGYRTLVVSTDPAHSISDIFGVEAGPTPTSVSDEHSLFAVEIDPEHRFNEHYADTFDTIMNEVQRFGVSTDELEGVDSGGIIGSDEAAVIDIFAEYAESDNWDFVVFDTAPTGHTLRMLRLPEVLDSAVGTVLNLKSQVDTVTSTVTGFLNGDDGDEQGLEDIDVDGTRNKLQRVSQVLQDPQRTQFFAVMEPEDLSLFETQRLLEQLDTYDIPVGGVVANKVLKDVDESCSLCSSRYEQQQEILAQADDEIDVPVLQIPLYETPPTTEGLEDVADRITVS